MIFFTPGPVIVKHMEKYLDITKPCYSEQILPVPWHIVILRFHSTIHYWGFLIFTDHSSNAHLKGFWKEAPSYSWSYVKFSFHFADKKTRNFLVKLFSSSLLLAEYCRFLLLDFRVELFLPDSSPPVLIPLTHLASVAQRLDSAIHRINLYPVDSVIIAKKYWRD